MLQLRTSVALALLAACGNPAAPAPLAGDRMVATSRDSIHVVIHGSGSPAVILVSGLGESMRPWRAVDSGLASLTTVFSYDRPGLGKSPSVSGIRSVAVMAEELHELLRRAGLRPPFVLTGHSLGGFVVELYASRYPKEVSGIVLVDPATEEFYARMDTSAVMRGEAARLAQAPPGVRAESSAFDSSRAEIRRRDSLPLVPIRMLIAGRHGPVPDPPVESVWLSAHLHWVAQHRLAVAILDTASEHHIQVVNPGLVVRTIAELVRDSRGRR